MKILLDTCVWGGVRTALDQSGHDAVWVGDWPQDPGDDQILAWAYEHGRTIVTLDKDFGELVVVRGEPHRGIVRLVQLSTREQVKACLAVLDTHGDDLQAGAIVTAYRGRLRIRHAEDHS